MKAANRPPQITEVKPMKKILAFLMAAVMLLALVACGKDNETETADIASPVELLTKVWDSYAEEDKFPAAGGDMSEENSNMEGPGVYSLDDAEGFVAVTHFPEDSISKIDSAATLMHMMNANTMTVAAYHVADSADVEGLASDVEESVMATQWMCGFPEKLVIITIGDYIVSYFGNGEVVDTFTENLKGVYPSATVATEKDIVA